MSFEFNQNDTLLNDFPNPYRFENVFLLLASLASAVGGIRAVMAAKGFFAAHDDKTAVLAIAAATLVLGIAGKLLIQALSQLRFYLGRRFPVGLAAELPLTETGIARGAKEIMETMRHRAIDFPEPHGALNGVLYSMVRSLATSPTEIQAAAVQHFHLLIAMVALFASLVVSYFMFQGTPYEGIASWLYLPMSGLSLITPFMHPGRLDVQSTEMPGATDNGNGALWKLFGLVVFSIMAPVLVPRIAPQLSIAPMWIAPALLLTGSMVASGLFFGAIVSRLDSAAYTSVSCEQTTIAMNCPPAQLWPALSRDFQDAWERGIPNRVYANIPPDVSEDDRGSFSGLMLEETQPVPTSTLQFSSWSEAFRTRYSRFLLLLGMWGVATAVACAWAAAHFTAQFVTMPRVEISRSILVVMALGMVSVLCFRIGHLPWSRLQFKSRLYWIETCGTYQEAQISIGNDFRNHAKSSSKLMRVEDATLRVWVTDIVSVAFGKDGQRSIIAMGLADNIAKSIAQRLIEFAANQSTVATPTADRDLARAASIVGLSAAVQQATASTPKASVVAVESRRGLEQATAAPAGRRQGRVEFYNGERQFGFIVDRLRNEYFFNSNHFQGKAPTPGAIVEFDAVHGTKGMGARKIVVKDVS